MAGGRGLVRAARGTHAPLRRGRVPAAPGCLDSGRCDWLLGAGGRPRDGGFQPPDPGRRRDLDGRARHRRRAILEFPGFRYGPGSRSARSTRYGRRYGVKPVRDVYVQYGCGWCAPKEWINFDASPTLFFERIPLLGRLHTKNASRFPRNVLYGNIVKGLPIDDGSAPGVYASHILEHLSRDEFVVALRHTYAMMRKGGIFRLIVPDLKRRAELYLD